MNKLKNSTKKVEEEEDKYSAAFTATALLFTEVQNIKQILLADDFEQLIEQEVKNNDLLGIKTEAARRRVTQEIRKRNGFTPKEFWSTFLNLNETEQRLALFYLCLKTYPLVMDFHIEVALKKWKSKALVIDNFDLQMRLDEIASTDEVVMNWTEKTQMKVITVYKRMLKEAGLLKKTELTKPKNISTDFWNYFVEIGDDWFVEACFYNKKKIFNLD